jgi:hypothetical protein
MHRDEVLHFLSTIKSPTVILSKDDSWILGSMALLLLGREPGHLQAFARNTMEIFKYHERFKNIRRVCLVKRLGLSNQIIIKSCEQRFGKDNKMAVGYSCFPDADGSLFQMKSSEMRYYADAKRVVESYQSKQKPPQRSIRKLADMGMKAGICLPLFQQKRSTGFVFINSDKEDFANLDDADYCILSYFEALATVALLDDGVVSQDYLGLALSAEATYVSDVLSAEVFGQVLGKHLAALNYALPQPAIEVDCSASLVSHGNLANILSRLAMISGAKAIRVEVSQKESKLDWQIIFEGARELSLEYIPSQTLWSDCRMLEIPIKLVGQALKFSLDREPAHEAQSVRYSI